MIFNIYDPPDGKKTWGELCLGSIVDFSGWEYEKYFCGAGTFQLTVPYGAANADKLFLGRFMLTKDGGFVIKQLKYNASEISVSGYDLNGLLLDRLTVAQTEDGKDKQTGSTEQIVKYFVEKNCVNAPDVVRNYPGLKIAGYGARGIPDDAASPRLQCLAEVISDILAAQKMGWRISANEGGAADELMIFDVIENKDRTWGQNDRDPVTFSYGLGNTNSINSERSIADAKNTLYCELKDGTVQTYSPAEDNTGFFRTEEYADLNCELGELDVYAEHEIADRFGEAYSVTLEHIDPYKFGEDFDLGDIVTVHDKFAGIELEALITAVKIKRSGSELNVVLTIGETRARLLDRVAKNTTAVSNSVKNHRPVEIKSAIIVSQYTSEYMKYEYTVLPVTTFPVLYGGSTSNSVICCGMTNGFHTYSKEISRSFDDEGHLTDIDYWLCWTWNDFDDGSRKEHIEKIGVNVIDGLAAPDQGKVILRNINGNANGAYAPFGTITVDIVFTWSNGDVSIWHDTHRFKSDTERRAALGLTTTFLETSTVSETATKMGGEFTPGSIPVDLN